MKRNKPSSGTFKNAASIFPSDAGFCRISISGHAEIDLLRAARWLVERGYLTGAFKPNPNYPDGEEWGWLGPPRLM